MYIYGWRNSEHESVISSQNRTRNIFTYTLYICSVNREKRTGMLNRRELQLFLKLSLIHCYQDSIILPSLFHIIAYYIVSPNYLIILLRKEYTLKYNYKTRCHFLSVKT